MIQTCWQVIKRQDDQDDISTITMTALPSVYDEDRKPNQRTQQDGNYSGSILRRRWSFVTYSTATAKGFKGPNEASQSARAALTAIMPSAVTHIVREMDLLHQVFRPAALQQKMMSWAAVRSGVGGVAAGGWLATLQSIGASGLGFQGTYRLKCQCCHDVFSTKENTTQVLPGSSSEVQAKRALKFQRNVF